MNSNSVEAYSNLENLLKEVGRIDEAKKYGHEIDLVNLFEEKEQLPFYNSNFSNFCRCILRYFFYYISFCFICCK